MIDDLRLAHPVSVLQPGQALADAWNGHVFGGKGRARWRLGRSIGRTVGAQPPRQFARQRHGRHRLAQVRLHSGLLAGFHILRIAIGGEGDDRQVFGSEALGAQAAGRFQPVHPRHLHVHQHRGERSTGIARRLDRAHGLFAVFDQLGLEPQRFCHGENELLVDRVILGDQHPLSGEAGHGIGRRRRGLGGGRGFHRFRFHQRQADGELRADIALGMHGDASAHHIDQLLADGEAEAGATIAPCDRSIFLQKRGEDRVEPILVDTDAAIDDGDQQALAVGGVLDPRFHVDAAAFGELDGVADQVQHHLPQPQPVELDHGGDGIVDPHADRQAFRTGHGLHQIDAMLQLVAQVGRLHHDVELAGFDLRMVEDIVQQLHHRPPRIGDHLQMAALILVEIAFHQELGEADHPVHRGADFVAHIGEEGGFRSGLAFGALAGVLQILFHVLDRLDVDIDPGIAAQLAVVVELGRPDGHDP